MKLSGFLLIEDLTNPVNHVYQFITSLELT